MLIDSWRPIRPLRWWGWIVLLLVSFALGETISLANHRLYQAFSIPTGSMKPTINPGDQILVSRCAYWFTEPHRGDLIAFRTSEIPEIEKDQSGKDVIYEKRIVGLPGDTVEILDPEIKVNGVEMKFGNPDEPVQYHHLSAFRTPTSDKGVYRVPEGKYFVLGDNSLNSYDSRYWGPISRAAIIGRITKIYWPLNRMATPR
jgi:signal peptidase I